MSSRSLEKQKKKQTKTRKVKKKPVSQSSKVGNIVNETSTKKNESISQNKKNKKMMHQFLRKAREKQRIEKNKKIKKTHNKKTKRMVKKTKPKKSSDKRETKPNKIIKSSPNRKQVIKKKSTAALKPEKKTRKKPTSTDEIKNRSSVETKRRRKGIQSVRLSGAGVRNKKNVNTGRSHSSRIVTKKLLTKRTNLHSKDKEKKKRTPTKKQEGVKGRGRRPGRGRPTGTRTGTGTGTGTDTGEGSKTRSPKGVSKGTRTGRGTGTGTRKGTERGQKKGITKKNRLTKLRGRGRGRGRGQRFSRDYSNAKITQERKTKKQVSEMKLEVELAEWISQILDRDFKSISPKETLQNILILCESACKLNNEEMPIALVKKQKTINRNKFLKIEFIEFFLRKCNQLGMKKQDLFLPLDYLNVEKYSSVLHTLDTLHKLSVIIDQDVMHGNMLKKTQKETTDKTNNDGGGGGGGEGEDAFLDFPQEPDIDFDMLNIPSIPIASNEKIKSKKNKKIFKNKEETKKFDKNQQLKTRKANELLVTPKNKNKHAVLTGKSKSEPKYSNPYIGANVERTLPKLPRQSQNPTLQRIKNTKRNLLSIMKLIEDINDTLTQAKIIEDTGLKPTPQTIPNNEKKIHDSQLSLDNNKISEEEEKEEEEEEKKEEGVGEDLENKKIEIDKDQNIDLNKEKEIIKNDIEPKNEYQNERKKLLKSLGMKKKQRIRKGCKRKQITKITDSIQTGDMNNIDINNGNETKSQTNKKQVRKFLKQYTKSNFNKKTFPSCPNEIDAGIWKYESLRFFTIHLGNVLNVFSNTFEEFHLQSVPLEAENKKNDPDNPNNDKITKKSRLKQIQDINDDGNENKKNKGNENNHNNKQAKLQKSIYLYNFQKYLISKTNNKTSLIDECHSLIERSLFMLNDNTKFPINQEVPIYSHKYFKTITRILNRIFNSIYFNQKRLFFYIEKQYLLYSRFHNFINTFELLPSYLQNIDF
ncbi:mob-like protein phocein [Anaeramoeba flamelloides]|uniref:Mob-like protein phocein n=1 Tax=Anaeramoeba flamelloides TaxID=1746091 RepID=A0AAV7YB87_9EUKA|nr:mob-like protein phocein [Anaeramoeba flamelloides]